jgi:hypothetical protein
VGAGTFTANTSTVTFSAPSGSTNTLTGQTTFYGFSDATPGNWLVFPAGSTTTVTGSLTLTGTSGSLIYVRSSSNGTYAFLKSIGTNNVTYVNAQDSYASSNTIVDTGGVDGTHNMNWIFAAAPVTSKQSGQWYDPTTWNGGVVPSAENTVTISASNVVTATAPVTVASITVTGELDLDGTSQSVTFQLPSGGQLTNNGIVKVYNSANNVTLQAQSGTMTFSGNDITYNGKKIFLAGVNYQPAMSLPSGATVQLGGPCTFSALTTNTGSSFIQGTGNNVVVTGNTALAAGTFTKDAGSGVLRLNGTLTLDTQAQDLGNVITGAGP